MPENITDFESLLKHQSDVLSSCKPGHFNAAFVVLAKQALEWFQLDRLTLFPNSMILLNDGKTISVSRKHVPPLDIARLLTGNYKDYPAVLKSQKPWQLFTAEELRTHRLDPMKELYAEGVRWHGIVQLKLFGQTWGAFAFSRFSLSGSKRFALSEQSIQQLKLISEVWLCFWQLSTVTRSLNGSSERTTEEESEKLLLLSKKQSVILTLLAQGFTAKQCADKLFLSPRTIESHKYRMLNLLQFENHTELVQFALRNGLGLSLEE